MKKYDIASLMVDAFEANKDMFSKSAMLQKLAFNKVSEENVSEVEQELTSSAADVCKGCDGKFAKMSEGPCSCQPGDCEKGCDCNPGLNAEADMVSVALNSLLKASEELDIAGFDKLSAYAITLADTLIVEAKKKAKDKKEDKSKTKKDLKKVVKKDKSKTDKLTSEKMVKNLKEKGWVFNDTNDASDGKFDTYVEIFDKNDRLIAFVKREFADRVLKSFPPEIGAHIPGDVFDYEDRFADKSVDQLSEEDVSADDKHLPEQWEKAMFYKGDDPFGDDEDNDNLFDDNDADDNWAQDKEFDDLLKKLVKDTKDWEDEE